MTKAERLAAIERARHDPRNLGQICRDAQRRNRAAGKANARRAREARLARMADAQDPTQSPDYVMHDEAERDSTDYCPPKDEIAPHEPGYHLTVNGETTVYVDYVAAIQRFVEVINGTLETGLTVQMDLVGEGITMGFMFERKA